MLFAATVWNKKTAIAAINKKAKVLVDKRKKLRTLILESQASVPGRSVDFMLC